MTQPPQPPPHRPGDPAPETRHLPVQYEAPAPTFEAAPGPQYGTPPGPYQPPVGVTSPRDVADTLARVNFARTLCV